MERLASEHRRQYYAGAIRNQVSAGSIQFYKFQMSSIPFFCSYPEHDLTVRRNTQSNNAREKKSMPVVQIDSDDDEFEDASESFNVDDEYFVENEGGAAGKRTEPLSKNQLKDHKL